MKQPSQTHVVLMPSYNPGPKIRETVLEALEYWSPIYVVVDGSDDGSAEILEDLARTNTSLKIIPLPQNMGKGAAIFEGMRVAAANGFTHVLTMDSDGQHPASMIPHFMSKSTGFPEAMILGLPDFGPEAPSLRVKGRKISNWWANLETLWVGIGDSLFGFRVYPIAPLYKVMNKTRWMRRFDFDPEAAVRLCWQGIPPVNVSAPVKYFSKEEGGVSHFQYVRDNKLLTWMHFRLMIGMGLRLPGLVLQRLRTSAK